MRILELLGAAGDEHSLTLATKAEIGALQELIVEKNDKTYLRCPVRQKDILAKPEEVVRQLWVHRLITDYKYPLERMSVEYPVTFGRDTSKRADIVVFDKDRPTVPYLIVEVKQTKLKDGKEQLKSYTHATGAPLALWSNGGLTIQWHRKNPNYFVELPDIPRASQRIEDIVDQPWTIQSLIDKENAREKDAFKARSLRDLIMDLECAFRGR